jgi:hypothetical protein
MSIHRHGAGSATAPPMQKTIMLQGCRKSHEGRTAGKSEVTVQSHCGVTVETGKNLFEKYREEVETRE